MSAPLVSVLMAARNAGRYIGEALASLWAQTLADFEVIVVDDASEDQTAEILAACSDKRLRVLRNDQQQGQTKALARGWRECRGDYIARLDADDIALPYRLEKQVAFLEQETETILLGGAAILVNERGEEAGLRAMPTSDLDIRWAALFRNPFLHSSIMARAAAAQQHNLAYDEDLEVAQDYELWHRFLQAGLCANLACPLIKLRLHAQSVSATAKAKQQEARLAISSQAIRRLLPAIEQSQVEDIYRLFIAGEEISQPAEAIRLYLRIRDAFAAREAGRLGIRRLAWRETCRGLFLGWRRLPWREWLLLAHYALKRPCA